PVRDPRDHHRSHRCRPDRLVLLVLRTPQQAARGGRGGHGREDRGRLRGVTAPGVRNASDGAAGGGPVLAGRPVGRPGPLEAPGTAPAGFEARGLGAGREWASWTDCGVDAERTSTRATRPPTPSS